MVVLIRLARELQIVGEEGIAEAAFAAFKRRYKGLCRKCGEYGHHNKDCPQMIKTNSFRFQPKGNNKLGVVWYYCGKKGILLETLSNQEESGFDKEVPSKQIWKVCT